MLHQKKQAGNFLPMTVIEGITVKILPDLEHEFLMSSKDVCLGYGTSEYTVRQTKIRHEEELIKGKHFISAVTICPSDPHNKVYWTKRGIIRLGFFIRSERSKLFRDWAEDLIIKLDEQHDLFGTVQRPAIHSLPKPRNHNRLTHDRLISILADVCRIDDKEIRLSITDKLMKGGDHAKA